MRLLVLFLCFFCVAQDTSAIDDALNKIEESERSLVENLSATKKLDNKEVIPELDTDDQRSPEYEKTSVWDINDATANLREKIPQANDQMETTEASNLTSSRQEDLANISTREDNFQKGIKQLEVKNNVEDLNSAKNETSKDNNLAKELDKKDHEISLLKASEESLKMKIKLYEEQIKKLNTEIVNLNKILLSRGCNSPTAADRVNLTAMTKPGSAEMSYSAQPEQYLPESPVPLTEISAGTVVYSGPDINSTPLLTIQTDTRVPKIDSVKGWVRIIAPNGVKGWVQRQTQSNIEQRALDQWTIIGR